MISTQTKGLEGKVILPSGDIIDLSNFYEGLMFSIDSERMPLFYSSPGDYFEETLGSDWENIIRLESKLEGHIEGLKWKPDSIKLKFQERTPEGHYVFLCNFNYNCPSDPGTITRRYTINPTISVKEEQIRDVSFFSL